MLHVFLVSQIIVLSIKIEKKSFVKFIMQIALFKKFCMFVVFFQTISFSNLDKKEFLKFKVWRVGLMGKHCCFVFRFQKIRSNIRGVC